MVSFVDELLKKYQDQYNKTKSFIKYISKRFEPKKVSNRLKLFYELSFYDFINELKKQKANLKTGDEKEIIQFFEDEKSEILSLIECIENIEYKLDNLIYKIYQLTDDEIKLIESK